MKSVNPATGDLIREYDEMREQEWRRIIERANKAQRVWREHSFSERAAIMRKAASLLKENRSDYARLMADEMGKPIAQGEGESEKCAWVCRYYADNAADFLEPHHIETDASESYLCYNPLGTILSVMPWNFPFWQLFRFAAPALMAGNAAVLKHASNVQGCALAIEELLHEAGVPEDLFRTLLIGSDQVDAVIEHSGIAAVTLTGSTGAGKAVAEKAGSLVKKTVLELGGSDPYLVLAEADIAKTAETCAASRMINGGQSCIAAKRFLVVEEVYDEFLDAFTERMKQQNMGDPLDENTTLGPQAREGLRDDLHRQVEESIAAGAECILGGEIPDKKGAYYPPTILTNVSKGMPAYEEELFGPVASVFRVKDDKEAVSVANDSQFGLGAAVFSEDLARAEQIAADELEAGCCFVNAFVKSDPRLPFGGVKESGYGRELSHLGIREFVNTKTVYIK